MRLGLTARILIGGGIVVVIFLIQFVLLDRLVQVDPPRHAARSSAPSATVVAAHAAREARFSSLETGTRGYVLTARPAIPAAVALGRGGSSRPSRELLGRSRRARGRRRSTREWRVVHPRLDDPARSRWPRARRRRPGRRSRAARAASAVDRDAGADRPVRRDAGRASPTADRARVAHAVELRVERSAFVGACDHERSCSSRSSPISFASPSRRSAASRPRRSEVADGDLEVKVPEQGAGRGRAARAARSTRCRARSSGQQRDLATPEPRPRAARQRPARRARLDGRRDPALGRRRQRAAREPAAASR